jgi:hypothetical protein
MTSRVKPQVRDPELGLNLWLSHGLMSLPSHVWTLLIEELGSYRPGFREGFPEVDWRFHKDSFPRV